MRIERLIIPASRERSLWQAHQVEPEEVQELLEDPRLKVLVAPDPEPRPSSRLFYLLGTTVDGRLLLALVRAFQDGNAYVITARDMAPAERRRYQRKG